MSKFIYLAQPIDLGTTSSTLTKFLDNVTRQVVVYRPAGAWSVPRQLHPNASLQEVNHYAMMGSAAVLAVLPHTSSIGVPSETALAANAGKLVIVLADHEVVERSWFLPWLEQRYANLMIVPYVEKNGGVVYPGGDLLDVEPGQDLTKYLASRLLLAAIGWTGLARDLMFSLEDGRAPTLDDVARLDEMFPTHELDPGSRLRGNRVIDYLRSHVRCTDTDYTRDNENENENEN